MQTALAIVPTLLWVLFWGLLLSAAVIRLRRAWRSLVPTRAGARQTAAQRRAVLEADYRRRQQAVLGSYRRESRPADYQQVRAR